MSKKSKPFNKATHPDWHWCNDTKKYEHKDNIIKFKTQGIKLIRHGRGKIGFVVTDEKGFTVVRTVQMKDRSLLSTYYFNGSPTVQEIRDRLFNNARRYSTMEKKKKKPYGIIYRYGVLDEDEWKRTYEPNTVFTKYKTVDKAFKSLGKCITNTDGDEILSASPEESFLKTCERIKTHRNFFANRVRTSTLPVVEVYAMWSNYDPETLLVVQDDYDAYEPLHYTFNRFDDIDQMKNHPM
jgi:hypothetical protein